MANQDDIQIVIAQPQHRQGILQVAEVGFIKGEPVRVALNVQWDDVKHDWEKLVDECLEKDHSHVAITRDNKVVGIRLSRITYLNNFRPYESINSFIPFGVVRTIEDHLTQDWATTLVDQNGKPCKKLLQFLSLAVHPDYGGRGLGVKMCEANMKFMKQLGCEYASVVASNWMSQRVFEKLGFALVKSIEFEKFNDQHGRKLVEIKDKKQVGSKWYIKQL